MSLLVPILTGLAPIAFLVIFRPDRIARLGRNAVFGIRTGKTTRSETAWRIGHEAAWPYVKWSSIALIAILVTVIVFALGLQGASRGAAAALGSSGAVLLWLAGLIVGVRSAHHAIDQGDVRGYSDDSSNSRSGHD